MWMNICTKNIMDEDDDEEEDVCLGRYPRHPNPSPPDGVYIGHLGRNPRILGLCWSRSRDLSGNEWDIDIPVT